MPGSARKLKFKAETRKVLDIVINSLYSHPDIFLRELISNSSDAIDRLRFRMLTSPELDTGREPGIEVLPDREARTLTVRDNGIGMSEEEMARELGTIASSGTRGFLDELSVSGGETTPELIGQFGVGFYSTFMVADRVEVLSRPAGSREPGHRWESTGRDTFTLREEEDIPEGTSVILHVKEGMDEYLEGIRLRELVRRYSDFISYPVYVRAEGTGDWEKEPVNSRKPIWTRPEEEVSSEEYDEFYRHLSFDPHEPLSRLVFHAEGTVEFYTLLYIPRSRSMEMLMPDYRTGVRLFIKKVMIEEEADELLPRYLRFIKGVVESGDLPLNISRESLQENRTVRVIRKALTGKVLGWLEDMLENDPDSYHQFWDSFGDLVKEGIYSDTQHRDQLADLLMVWTPKNLDRRKSLKAIADGLPEEKDRIFYITGADRMELASSPYLESAGRDDEEVLLFDSPVDEFMLGALGEYRGRKLVSLLRELDEGDLSDAEKAEKKHAEETYAGLLEYMQNQLGDSVEVVRFSPRLKDSPCIIVSDRSDPGDMLRQMMRSLNQDIPDARKILELNPTHPVIGKLQELYEKERSGDRLKDYVRILFDLGTVMAGGRPENPAEFGRRVTALLK
ncbi:MAG: molecular chaperone HtpG [Candidatus Fermentibacteraceae bacterium]|nr:molecular chaperone HtpG [Candidatus Fermentibacteraceae bacterium]